MIGRLSTAAAGHILKRNGRISGNVLGEDRPESFGTQIAHPAGTGADDESNRFALVKRSLCKRGAGACRKQCRHEIKKSKAQSPIALKVTHRNLL
jgi:hypothetical protein